MKWDWWSCLDSLHQFNCFLWGSLSAEWKRWPERKFISGGVLKIRVCIFPPDPTAIPKVHSRAGSQWRWEEAFSKGGSHSAHPAASHKGKRLSIPKQWEQFPAPRIYHTEAQNSNVPSFVSMKKGFWRKYAEKFVTSSRPRRAERRKRSTSMGWKAGNIQI